MKRAIALVIAFVLVGTSGFAEGANLDDSGQEGTAALPWVISSLADFQAFCSDSGYWDGHTRLDCDIDLTKVDPYTQAPIAGDTDTDSSFDGTAFSGTFNGNGHTLNNLTVSGPHYCGLFGKLANESKVINLALKNASISSTKNYIGGIVGWNDGLIESCYLECSVGGDDFVGTVAGWNNLGQIVDCNSTGTVDGYVKIGGTAGQNNGTISESCSSATVNGKNYAGGMVGQNDGTITGCHSTGQVNGDNDNIGGLVGYNHAGSITSSYWSGEVSGEFYVGGVTGRNTGTVTDCYSTGTIAGKDYIGGLVSVNEGTAARCYSTAQVDGDDYVGGLAAQNIGTITKCYSTGMVTGIDDNVGGLVGDNSSGRITSSYSTGTVSGDANIGGLAGNNNGDISCCYSTGEVIGRYAVGGLVGYLNNGSVTSCYSTGLITGSSYFGGLAGKKGSGSVADSFWDVETSLIGESGDSNFEAIGKTTTQMRNINTFLNADWDFDPDDDDWEDWQMPDGDYPILYWQNACLYILAGDLNRDCKIDLADLAIMASNWMIDCIADPTNSSCIPY